MIQHLTRINILPTCYYFLTKKMILVILTTAILLFMLTIAPSMSPKQFFTLVCALDHSNSSSTGFHHRSALPIILHQTITKPIVSVMIILNSPLYTHSYTHHHTEVTTSTSEEGNYLFNFHKDERELLLASRPIWS